MGSKHTQAEANYGRGDPISHCGICAYYRGHGACSEVMGRVSPYGLSDVFRPEPNPFGKTLTTQEKAAIVRMAMDATDRTPAGM